MRIRSGGAADVPAVLAMGDEAVAWMVSRGNTEQWGTEPLSTRPKWVELTTSRLVHGDAWIAELDGVPAGVLVVGTAPEEHIPAVDEPELYVHLLLTSRRYAGREVGATLLAHARSLAAERGVSLVRVDCYRGGDESLVRYYERNGFGRTETFVVRRWPGQVLAHRLPPR